MAPLAERLAGKDLLIDSNLLVLLVVGLVRPESVGGKRLEKYTLPHFETLCQTIVSAGRVILTPHVLAETSNLVKMALYGEPQREALAVLMLDELPFGDENSRQAKVVMERHVPKISLSLEIVNRPGIADAGLLSAAMTERHVLVTDDADLYWGALSQGSAAENFNHVWNE